jgi:hypothetical protein
MLVVTEVVVKSEPAEAALVTPPIRLPERKKTGKPAAYPRGLTTGSRWLRIGVPQSAIFANIHALVDGGGRVDVGD